MDCSEYTGIRRQVCEGRLIKADGRTVVISQNARQRYLAVWNGQEIPPKIKGSTSVIIGEAPEPPPPAERFIGVGSELHSLLESLGIKEGSCGCLKKAAQMDVNGVAYCEREKATIVEWLVKSAEERLRQQKSKLLWIPESIRESSERIVASHLVDNAIAETKAKIRTLVGPLRVAVGVTTAFRKGPNLLARCVQSLQDTGLDEITVYAEPDAKVPTLDVPVVRRKSQLGAWHNWMQALAQTLAKGTDYVLIVQDDCVFAKDVRDFISAIVWPNDECSAIQLCCSSYYKNLSNGLSRMPGTGMLGAWATLMPAYHAQEILEYGLRSGWRGHHSRIETDPVKMKAIDDYIGYASEQLGYHCRICRPSIVLHDAEYSSLGHGDSKGSGNNRKTLNWIGENASALDYVPIPKERVSFQK